MGNKVLWFTGLSGAGKSTLAQIVADALTASGQRTTLLDGDVVRCGLCRDLGFTDADRSENIRRVAEVAKLMSDAGLVVIVAMISPFTVDRERARAIIGAQNFIEIFVDAPLAVTEGRDVKGLYRRARAGELPNFTGVDSVYEPPLNPAVYLRTDIELVQECAKRVLDHLYMSELARD